MKITTPSMSSRRQKRSMCWEWFIKVWYVADNDRHVAADNMKMVNISSHLIPAMFFLLGVWYIQQYLATRYSGSLAPISLLSPTRCGYTTNWRTKREPSLIWADSYVISTG